MEYILFDDTVWSMIKRIVKSSQCSGREYEKALSIKFGMPLVRELENNDPEQYFFRQDRKRRIFSYYDLIHSWYNQIDQGKKVTSADVLDWSIKKWQSIVKYGMEFSPQDLLQLSWGDCGLCIEASLHWSSLISPRCARCQLTPVEDKLGFHPCQHRVIPKFVWQLKNGNIKQALILANQYLDILIRLRDNNWEGITKRIPSSKLHTCIG